MAGTEEDPIDLLAEAFPEAFGPNASPQADLAAPSAEPPLQPPSDPATATVPDQPGSIKDPCQHFLKRPAKPKLALQLVINSPERTYCMREVCQFDNLPASRALPRQANAHS